MMLKVSVGILQIHEDTAFLMDLNDEDGIWDSVMLEPLTEETFISNLNCRYESNIIYVSTSNSFIDKIYID